MKDYTIIINGEKFTVKIFFDVDTQESGVYIKKGRKYIGEIVGLDLPDKSDVEQVKQFEKEITEWLSEKEY